MISEEQIQAVAERLRRAAPDATIILFGSHARGDAREDSDLDILVVEPTTESVHAEMVRLDTLVSDLPFPVDIVVTDESTFRRRAVEPCTVYHDAAHEGRVLHARRSVQATVCPPTGAGAGSIGGEPGCDGWRRGAGVLPEAAIREIGERLHRAAPDATIVLRGSYGRGDPRENSDIDILVIEPEVGSVLDETTRLADALGDTDVPVDLVVTDRATHERRERESGALRGSPVRDAKVLHGGA